MMGIVKPFSKDRRTDETTGISPQRTQRNNIIYKNSVASAVKIPQKEFSFK